MEHEINDYVDRCQQEMDHFYLNQTAVTDHEPRAKKLHTNSRKEDRDFYNYKKSLAEFNSDVNYAKAPKPKLTYHLDTALSKILDPLLGMKREATGAYAYEFQDSDLTQESEEKLRLRFLALVEENNTVHNAEDDEDETTGSKFFMDKYLEEKEKSERFKRDIQEELSVFKKGEEYSYVKDLQTAYKSSLSKSKFDMIFETLPEHVFYDIKTPKNVHDRNLPYNKVNALRPPPFESFWDKRNNEDYFHRREALPNLKEAQSMWRRY